MKEDKNKQLINLACEDIEDRTSHFYYYLIGWMGSNHHEEMASAARSWMETYAPEKLANFDKNSLDNTFAV